MESLECMRVYIQGGSLKLLIPVPEPAQTVTWLKNDFKLRALRRGRDVTVIEITCSGLLLSDDDRIADVIPDQSLLMATGHGIEAVADLPPVASSEPLECGRSKRKYTRGGHKKLKLVAPILESYLPEMSTTSEKERQKFYAKIVALPQMIMAEVNRDEVVSWYKRARKKYRIVTEEGGSGDPSGGDEDGDDDDSRTSVYFSNVHTVGLAMDHPMLCDELSRDALAAADDLSLPLHLDNIPHAPTPYAHYDPLQGDPLHGGPLQGDPLQGDPLLALAQQGDHCGLAVPSGLYVAPPITGAQPVIGL